MAVGTETYKTMLQQFGDIASAHFDSETLEELKQEYKDIINSNRTFDNIHDIKSLLRVLDKRDVLRYDDISELKNIEQKFIQNGSVQKLISDYEQWLIENLPNISDLYTHGKSFSPSNDRWLCENVTFAHGSVIYRATSNNCTIEKLDKQTQLEEKPVTCSVIQSNNIHYQRSSKHKCFSKIAFKTWALFVVSALILVLGGIICNSTINSHSPSAVVPRIDPVTIPVISHESRVPLPEVASEVKVGLTTTATISVNQTQNHGINQALNSDQDRQKELQDLVLKEISKRVGRHWKDISRKLDLQESVLEDIEIKYSGEIMGFQKMFNQAVEIYFAENHQNWKLQLLQALESARRRDLKELAQEIILRYDSIRN